MLPDHKKSATLILGIGHSPPAGSEGGGDGGTGADPGLSAAADDLISAIKAGDTDGVASALKAAYQVLDSQGEEPSES